MSQYFHLLGANFKMTVRNRQSIFWQFVFPVLLMSLFGIVFGGGTGDAKIAIVNQDTGKLSAKVVDTFDELKGFKVRHLTFKEALTDLKGGDVDAVVLFDKGFSERVSRELRPAAIPMPPGIAGKGRLDIQPKLPPSSSRPKPVPVALYYDPSGTFTSQAVRGTVTAVLGEVDRNLAQTPRLLMVKTHSVRSSSLSYIDFLVPGIIAMTLMNSAMFGLGGTIVNYRERGILRRLKVTPQPLTVFIAAQITNQLLFSVIRAGLLVLVGTVAFGVAMMGNYWLLLLVIIVGSLCFTTIAFSVASFSATRETADTIGNLISMPMMFLGGVFFPVDSAPKWIQPLIKVLPLKYLGDAMRDVMVKGQGFAAIRTDMMILAAVTAVFFVVSVRFWRWE